MSHRLGRIYLALGLAAYIGYLLMVFALESGKASGIRSSLHVVAMALFASGQFCYFGKTIIAWIYTIHKAWRDIGNLKFTRIFVQLGFVGFVGVGSGSILCFTAMRLFAAISPASTSGNLGILAIPFWSGIVLVEAVAVSMVAFPLLYWRRANFRKLL